MKTTTKLFLTIFIVTIFGCDKREDIYAAQNLPPTLEVNANSTPLSVLQTFSNNDLLLDSFNLVYNEYLINFKTVDEYKDATLSYVIDNNATITKNSQTQNKTNDLYTTIGELKVIPTNLGLHNIIITVTDKYGESTKITIKLNVYLRDAAPIISISTVNNLNNNNPTYTSNNIIDTFSISQGVIIIDYRIFDDNSNYVMNISTSNGLLTEDIPAKQTTQLPNSVIVTGKLRLTPTTTGSHLITIGVTDFVGQTTTITANIYIVDIPAQLFVDPGLNQFASINGYVPTFNELFLFGQGNYEIKYKIIDDTPIPNFTFNSTNFGVLTDDINQKTTTTVGAITTVEGVLILNISFTGIHNINLNIQESSGTTTSSNILDVRNNTPPVMNSLSGSMSSSSFVFNWTASDVDIPTFNDVLTYEVKISRVSVNPSVVFNQTGITVLNHNYSMATEDAYLTSIGYQGWVTYKAEVRAYDIYGGVSAWISYSDLYAHF